MTSQSSVKKEKQSGFFSNLLFNIIIPAVILSRFSDDGSLGPVWSLVVALAFPLSYGLWELYQSGKVNFFSVLGIISVLLTGGISLFQLDPAYIAIKEAAIPGLIGVIVLISQFTPFPLVKKLLLNPQLLDTDKLYQTLDNLQNRHLFEQRVSKAGYIVASAFFVSSALNYLLAKWIVVSQPGTTAYAEELGKMTWMSYPVIVLPVMLMLFGAIWYIFQQISRLTGQSLEDFMRQ